MPTPIRALIIEDEAASISTLKSLLAGLPYEVQILGEAATVESGIQLIEQKKPELVFMDIQLADGSSFEIIDRTDYSSYQVIFITAYHQHAIRAFDIAAIHYLMKPISVENLSEAIDRFMENRNNPEFDQRIRVMRSQMNNEPGKIILPLSDGLSVIRLDEIIRCESSNNYTTFFLRNNRQLVVSRPINFYEQLLSELNFARVHSKHLINLQYVERYVKGRGGYVLMAGGDAVDVSPGKRRDFLDQLNRYACGY